MTIYSSQTKNSGFFLFFSHVKFIIWRNFVPILKIYKACTFFFFKVQELYCELNYYDQKIRRRLAHDIRKHWTAVSIILSLISGLYRDLSNWKSNQRPQNAEPKLYNWAISQHRIQVMLNHQVMVIGRPINLNVTCKLHPYTLQKGTVTSRATSSLEDWKYTSA